MRNFIILNYRKILNYLQVNCVILQQFLSNNIFIYKKIRGQQEQLRDSGVLRQQHVQRHQRVFRVLLQRRHNQIKVFKKTLKMRYL